MTGKWLNRAIRDISHNRHFTIFRDADERGRRRSAIERVIGHLKSEHGMGRNYLWHRQGDATNAVRAAVGYNFRRLLRWLELLLHQILVQLILRLQLVPS